MAKKFFSFRLQMLMIFSLSIALAGLITFALFKWAQWYYHNYVYREDSLAQLRSQIASYGDINAFLTLFIPLAFLFFILFTKKYARYFNEISSGIRHLAEGDFSQQVTIDAKDEFAVIARDINQAASMLEQAVARGDFSESSKDQLVVNLAHDLRTPLTSVLGYLDLILKDATLSEEQARHFLGIAHTKAQHLEKLIDTLFEITRMNHGMLPLHKSEFDLTSLLQQLIEEMYPIFENTDLQARLNTENTIKIFADADLLARVFENLLTNACRYGADGQFVDITVEATSDNTIICISNYGNIISDNDLPYLFDIFYTADQARSQQKNSTGLGLFIAKNIIEQHGGTISATSDIRQTTFTVTLPTFYSQIN